jgi:serine/threonine protein kinase
MDQQKIGKYEILEELGAGTVGQVYRARNTETGTVVALKLLHGSVAHNPDIERRFVREVTVLQQLEHENIVRYDFCGLHDDCLFFTMEQVDSGTLKDVLSGPMPWRDCAEVAVQICAALQHAHEKGIVHRDLKPANLFLSEDGKVKLGDFGIALDADNTRLTVEGNTVGTVRYMAPEQFIGSDVTAKADLYSLGCILFEMLTFSVPFDGKTDMDVMKGHVDLPPPHVRQIAPDCPQELDSFVRRLLAKNPDERPVDAAMAQESLQRILDAENVANATDDTRADEEANAAPNLTERLKSTRHSVGDQVSWGALATLGLIVVGSLVAYAMFAF